MASPEPFLNHSRWFIAMVLRAYINTHGVRNNARYIWVRRIIFENTSLLSVELHLMLSQELRSKIHPQAGSFGNLPVVELLVPASDEDFLVLAGLLVSFLHDQKVRNRRGQVHARRCTNGPVGIVRGDRDVMGVGHRRDLLHSGYPAGAGDVGLKYARSLFDQDLAEIEV